MQLDEFGNIDWSNKYLLLLSVSIPAVAYVGAGVAAAGVASAAIGAGAAKDAAKTQATATTAASQNTANEFGQIQSKLAPYNALGAGAASKLADLTGTSPGGNPLTAPLTAPFASSPGATQAALEATPGYQFTKTQGLEATQNGFAAQGLGTSGAAAKGAANYAEGLASTTYQNQFNNYLTQQQQIAKILQDQVSTGANAAGLTANAGLAATSQENALTTSGAAATAAGQVGSANALTSGINGISSAALLYGLSDSSGALGGTNSGSTGAFLTPKNTYDPAANPDVFGANPFAVGTGS